MKRLAFGISSVLILALRSATAFGETAAPVDPRLQENCASESDSKLRECAAGYTARIRVARMNADEPELGRLVSDLEKAISDAAAHAPGMEERMCDVDCVVERASARLFHATTFTLLNDKPIRSESGARSESALLKQVMEGLRIVDNGLRTLPRKRGNFSQASVTNNAATYNRYLDNQAKLLAIKVRLLMAGGDLWYRTASADSLRTVGYAVAQGLGNDPQSGKELELAKAQTFYEEAYWALVESQMGLPIGVSDSSARHEIQMLRGDLQRRLDSVRKGFLYIGIDPDEQTPVSIERQARQLVKQAGALRVIEQQTSDIRKEWRERAKAYAEANLGRQIENDRYANGKAIELEGFRLAEVQNAYGRRQTEMEGKLSALRTQGDLLDTELRTKQVLATLEREKLEISHELRMVTMQSDQELLALNKESIDDELAEIATAIDRVMTDYNFDMQTSELSQRIESLTADSKALQKELEQVVTRKTQIGKQREVENERIRMAATMIEKLNAMRTRIFEKQIAAIVADQKALSDELGFFDDQKDALKALCVHRDSIHATGVTNLITLLQSYSGLEAAYGVLKTGNIAVLSAEIDSLQNATTQLLVESTAYENSVTQVSGKYQAIAAADQVLKIAEIAAGAASGVAAVATTTMSASQCFITEMGFSIPNAICLGAGVAAGALQLVEAAANQVVIHAQHAEKHAEWEIDEFRYAEDARRAQAEISRSMIQNAGAIGKLNLQKLVEEAAEAKSLAELGLEKNRITNEISSVAADQRTNKLECKSNEIELTRTETKLNAMKEAYTADIAAKRAENSLFEYDVQEQRHMQNLASIEIERLDAEDAELELEKQKLEGRKQSAANLVGAVSAQIERVNGYKQSVAGLARQQDGQWSARKELSGRIKDLLKNKTDAQRSFAEAALSNANAAAENQVSTLRDIFKNYEQGQVIQDAITGIQLELSSAITTSNERLQSLSSFGALIGTQPDTETQLAKVFWDFENTLAETSRGIPDILERKRLYLENANYFLNLYRNRYRLLSSFATNIAEVHPSDTSYAVSAAEIEDMLGKMCPAVGDVVDICEPNTLALAETDVAVQTVTFSIGPYDSLMEELVNKGWVRFEVSPNGGDRGVNPGRVLWADNLNSSEPQFLLDASVTGTACVDPNNTYPPLFLKHLGFGLQRRQISGSGATANFFLAMGTPAEEKMTLLAAASGSFAGQRNIALRKLEEMLDGSERNFPFLGYPVIGTYEIRLLRSAPDDPEGVSREHALRKCIAKNRPTLSFQIIVGN